MTVAKNRTMPKWLDDFIQNLSTSTKIASNDKLAEININDLPKVVWNDETFHVMFDEDGATVLNDFANTVTTIKGAQTIEDVDKELNSKTVVTSKVASNDIFAEELEKVSSYLKIGGDDNGVQPNQILTNTTPTNPNQPETVNVTVNTPTDTQPTDPNVQPTQPVQPDPNVQQQPQPDSNNPQPTTASINDLEKDVTTVESNLDLRERVINLENMISRLAKSIEALTQQEYAHTNPGPVYDNNTAGQELQHAEESAQATSDQINMEHNVDLTTMEGRLSLREKLHQELEDILNIDDEGKSENVTNDEFKEEDFDDLDENPELPKDDNSIDEMNFTDDDIDLNEEDDKDTENVDLTAPENNLTPDITKDELGNDADVSVEDDSSVHPEKKDDIKSPDDINNEDDKKDELKPEENKPITKLNSRDSKIFQNQVCVKCGEKSLVKSKTVGSFVGVYCKSCNAEYAVDTTTGDIFNNNN
jgi:hypothetical protein